MKIICRFRSRKDAHIRRLDCGNCSGSRFTIEKIGLGKWVVVCCKCSYMWSYGKSTMKAYRFYG